MSLFAAEALIKTAPPEAVPTHSVGGSLDGDEGTAVVVIGHQGISFNVLA